MNHLISAFKLNFITYKFLIYNNITIIKSNHHDSNTLKLKKELKKWFYEDIKLPQYFKLFYENGYEDISYFDEHLVEDDLIEVGVKKKGHRHKILSEIKKLIKNKNHEATNIFTHN